MHPVPKVRRGGYVFVSWVGDHSPRHVHVYRDGKLVEVGSRSLASDERRSLGPHPGLLRELVEERKP
jgi:hypothetical protein